MESDLEKKKKKTNKQTKKQTNTIKYCSGVNIESYYNEINIGPISSIGPNGENKSNID